MIPSFALRLLLRASIRLGWWGLKEWTEDELRLKLVRNITKGKALRTALRRKARKLTPCPSCGVVGESDPEETFLTCPECLHEWQREPL